ncbi:MAG: right-handed parallel beta-helix repeat-containing protein [Methanotrichaceae archaeon]|nr:right-handed parallel beta-helix repeat-containing protein [Methanotrichaceae archaeon]
MKRFWFLGILMLMASTEGRTFVVDPSGASDFKSISQAISSASPGDTILIKPGEYGSVVLDRSIRIIGLTAMGDVVISARDSNALSITAPGCIVENLSIVGIGINPAVSIDSLSNLVRRCNLRGSTGLSITGENNTFKECQIDSSMGMKLIGSRCHILDCTFSGAKGISINNGSENEIEGCKLLTATGLEMVSSSGNMVLNNSLIGEAFGISLLDSMENWIDGNDISGLYVSGIDLRSSGNNNISRNRVYGCKVGISLRGTYNNDLINNTCRNNERAGIYSNDSRNNEFQKNELVGNGNGILLTNSVSDLLESNKASGNIYGISLRGSIENILRDNSLIANGYNLRIDTGEASSDAPTSKFDFYVQDIDNSNHVDGKPVCYLLNKTDVEAPRGCGFVGLVGCRNIIVLNQSISNSSAGILIVNSTGCKVTGCNLARSEAGIEFLGSSNWTVERSQAERCEVGYLATESKDGLFLNDIALNCREAGIKLTDSLLLNVTSSYAQHCGNGVSLLKSRLCSLTKCNTSQNEENGITFVDSHKCSIKDIQANLNGRGLALSGSNACLLENNSINSNRQEGIALEQLSGAELRNNSASANSLGLFVQSSQKILLEDNNLSQNRRYGLRMSSSSQCEIIENTFLRNEICGISLVDCTGNLLYHNILANNGIQNAVDNGDNQWDAGPKLGGNYWGDAQVLGNPSSTAKQIQNKGIDRYPFQDPAGWR